MAFTERYVTGAAKGGGDGSKEKPWTLAEAFDNAEPADRVNIKSDRAYSIGETVLGNAGTQTEAIVYRGYNWTIGDLNDASPPTKFPVIKVTGAFLVKVCTFFRYLCFRWSHSALLGNDFCFIHCEVPPGWCFAGAGRIRIKPSQDDD